MKSKSERAWFHEMCRRYYPEVIERHEGKAKDIGIVKATYSNKELKAQCKFLGVSYFSVMSREQLVRAVELKNLNTAASLKELGVMSWCVKEEYLASRGSGFFKAVVR